MQAMARRGEFWLALGSLLWGCQSHSDAHTSAAQANAQPSAAVASTAVKHFGAALTAGTATPIQNVLESPERYQSTPLLVTGFVRRACSRRGCWMELAGGADPKLPGCRVTFKDYGFFVPTDSAGSSARVEAALELATLAPAAVDHMEREGASFPKKEADGSAKEVRLVATGVELWR